MLTDESGRAWDVTVGRESWGTVVLLFSPRSGGEPRKHTIAPETVMAGELYLDGLNDSELRGALRDSEPWRG